MKYQTLGKTGQTISAIGLGSWQFGGEWGRDYSEAEVAAIVDACRETGINLIDTAECYGHHLAEKLIGAAIENDREKWFVATKFGHHFTERFKRDDVWDTSGVMKALDASLKALRTDHIDLLQFHSGPDDDFFNDDLWEALNREKAKGKVRFLGNSIGDNGNLKQIEKSPDYGIEVIQIIYNRLDRQPEEAVFPAIARMNLGVLARVPLASGYLSGKYKVGASFASEDWRSYWMSGDDRDRMAREVESIARREVPEGVPMAQWALAWCLRNPVVSAVIPGCKDPAQLLGNAAAAGLI